MIFPRKKKQQAADQTGRQVYPLRKNFPTADKSFASLRHTDEFLRAGIDPLADEEQIIAGMPADWLLMGMREPAIRAEGNKEIVHGKEEVANALLAIQILLDKQRGEYARAEEMLSRIDDEIAGYDRKLEELRALSK